LFRNSTLGPEGVAASLAFGVGAAHGDILHVEFAFMRRPRQL
jgi:hypothetical protein